MGILLIESSSISSKLTTILKRDFLNTIPLEIRFLSELLVLKILTESPTCILQLGNLHISYKWLSLEMSFLYC